MNFKYNTKQRSKTVQGLRSFKDTLPKEAKRIIKKKGEIYSKTLENWKFFVGNDLFKFSYPKSFKNTNKILKKINSYFGYNVAENIRFKTFSVEAKKNLQEKKTDATKKDYLRKITSIKNKKIMNSLLEFKKLFKVK